MKTWKIFKAGSDTIAYVNVNEKDNRDTAYYALQLARKYFNDYSISGTQLLVENEDKKVNIPTLELYYPETFTFNGIDYILEHINCALWTNEAHGFCRCSDGSDGLFMVDFNNKQDLLPVVLECLCEVNKRHRKRSIKQVTNGKCCLLLLLKNGGIHMRITTYKTELNNENLNILVKEKSCNCTGVETLNNPSLITEMFNVVFRLNRQTEEYLYMLALTTKGKPLGVFEVSHGIVDATICNPREIFIKALLCGASGIVIIHNHPSGDTTPSKQDIESYNCLKEAGKLIGINVLDSIIVGESYYSFHENGI